MQRFSTLVFLVLLAHSTSLAQDFLLNTDTTIYTCSGRLLDSGNIENGYQPNEMYHATICSTDSVNTHVRITFDRWELGIGDVLTVINGESADDPILVTLDGTRAGAPLVLSSNIENESGCITVLFESDNNIENNGWLARIACILPCQPMVLDWTITSEDARSGNGLLKVCSGSTLDLSANPSFPQNDQYYHQSATTCTYTWTATGRRSALGNPASIQMPTTGEYKFKLEVVDINGCRQVQGLDIPIRVAPRLMLHADNSLPETICVGDSLIVLHTQEGDITGPNIAAPPLPLTPLVITEDLEPAFVPDGRDLPPFESQLLIEGYPDSTVFGDLIDNQFFWLNFEHSFSGDLTTDVICPSGESVRLFEDVGGATNFGEPFADGSIDALARANDPTPGIGYDYFFRDNAPNGYLRNQISTNYTYTTMPSEVDERSFTYSDSYFPSGDYEPISSIRALATCPVNGTWTLRIDDNLNRDNGWLFGWGFAAPDGRQQSIVDNVVAETWQWADNPMIVEATQQRIAIVPQIPGTETLELRVTDNYGCQSDLNFSIETPPLDNPACIITSTGNVPTAMKWHIGPNPTYDVVSIDPAHEQFHWQYTLSNSTGQILRQGQPTGKLTLDISQLPIGIYYLIGRSDSVQNTWRLIKQ